MDRDRPLRFVTGAEMEVEELPWGPHEWLCRPGLTEAAKLQLVRVRMPPGKGHAFHRHPAMEEIIYVVSGRAEQWVERTSRTLGPGDTAHIPMDTVHATYNAGDGTLVFLAILSPATFDGPALVDVSGEEPWRSVRSGDGGDDGAGTANDGAGARNAGAGDGNAGAGARNAGAGAGAGGDGSEAGTGGTATPTSQGT